MSLHGSAEGDRAVLESTERGTWKQRNKRIFSSFKVSEEAAQDLSVG